VPKGPRDSQLVEVDLKKGTARPVGERLWRQINDLHWLPDAGGFVLNEVVEERQALYSVSYPEGRVTQVPADSHKYWGLSMTPDGTKLVSQQTIGRADVLVSRDPERGSFKKVLSGTNVNYRFSWTPDGKLVYSSNEGGSYDLYVSDADGSNRKQLTFDRDRDEREPAASPDGRHIVFVSNRSGEWQLYRIDRDGTGLRRLTDERVYRERDPRITSDGRSVLYRRWDNGPSLWKVPIEGGTPTLVRGVRPSSADGKIEIAFGASAAPDGKALAFLYFTMDSKRGGFSPAEIAIGSIDGDLVKRLPYLDSHQGGINDDQRVQWSHDGSTLYYNRFEGPGIVWKRPAAGGPPIQVTRFEEAARYFDWSPDGKTLAVSRMSSLSDIVLITNFR
jgi:Tol biopolymer transport system component